MIRTDNNSCSLVRMCMLMLMSMMMMMMTPVLQSHDAKLVMPENAEVSTGLSCRNAEADAEAEGGEIPLTLTLLMVAGASVVTR